MGFKSEIGWTDGTFNPWAGCEPVSAGCAHCYAKRNWSLMGLEPGERRLTSDANWKKPLAWNRQMEAEGRTMKVFCGSICDVFDQKVPEAWRENLFELIRYTTNLTWLLLTKRAADMAYYFSCHPVPDNVWVGVTAENQAMADERIPYLLGIDAPVRFVSVEPMLGRVDLTHIQMEGIVEINALNGDHGVNRPLSGRSKNKLDQVIGGCESGPYRRHVSDDDFRFLRDQCVQFGVPFFLKQMEVDGKVVKLPELDGRVWNEFPKVKVE